MVVARANFTALHPSRPGTSRRRAGVSVAPIADITLFTLFTP
jgi:hypothetical protein